jgi:hypothetical protein
MSTSPVKSEQLLTRVSTNKQDQDVQPYAYRK